MLLWKDFGFLKSGLTGFEQVSIFPSIGEEGKEGGRSFVRK